MFSVPAKVLIITPDDSYVMNISVELVCSVEGDPPPYVAWINVADGSVLQNRTVNTNYVIPSVSSINKGTYRCVTGNICGNDRNETTITDVLSKYDGNLITLHVLICWYASIILHQFIIEYCAFHPLSYLPHYHSEFLMYLVKAKISIQGIH